MAARDYRFKADYLQKFMADVLHAAGVPRADAAICADVLITSDKRGIDSHGINRCKSIYYDRIRKGVLNPVTKFEVVRETPTTAVVDGHNGMGHVIARRCMAMAIRKAKRNGLGMVVTRRSTHYGIAGYYALMATDAGMIGITGTNARPSIAPTFGVENMLGTNPMTFGIPTNERFPFVLDCATSVSQRGKIELYEREGKRLPGQWVIDRKNHDVRDAKEALAALVAGTGALTPLGGAGEDGAGYKGYGYATVVEILSSALQAGNFMKALSGVKNGKPSSIELGHFFMAINVEAFTGLSGFRRRCGDLLKQLRSSDKAPGERRIYTAGEKEHLCWLERKKKGIPVTPAGQKDLSIMRDETGLKKYVFPWD